MTTPETIQSKIYQEENDLDGIPERVRIKYKIRDDVEAMVRDVFITEGGTLDDNRLITYRETDNLSVSNMASAVLTIKEYLRQIYNLYDFLKFIFKNALFIYVSTDNTEDAFRMFTILNDRGIPLTNADILKSENIGAISAKNGSSKEKKLKIQDTIKQYAKQWEEIEGKHEDKFDRFLQFLRTIYIKEKARTNLLEEFETKIYGSTPPLLTKGKESLDAIIYYNDIYENVIDLQGNYLSNEYRNLITIMKEGMRSDDWIPPILYFYHKFKNDNLLSFVRKLEYKFTADWVCGITPTMRLDAMNEILKAIDSANNSTDVITNSKLYEVNYDDYREILNTDVYTKRYAKMLLLKIEFLLSDNNAHISNYGTISVEHVLPQHPDSSSKWNVDFTQSEQQTWIHKIGNLVLLSKKKNSKLGNLDFVEKKEKYFNTRMDVFKATDLFLKQTQTWTPTVIEKRQNAIINLLLSNEYSTL